MSLDYNKISKELYHQFKEIVRQDYSFSDYEIRWTYAFGSTIFVKGWVPELI